ncbi:hypothetical protein WICPIJ_001659 [Wickerhamomyces pijperi]|uniref:Uncharacterized protein n=1 Tax=Wickerhamomyces pijperi TaxID=599730 RepID=A0A9P8QB82_WICPI|nr:hypothetical protein WICPIJ_001659 [Wickerhamomyces pijperi]
MASRSLLPKAFTLPIKAVDLNTRITIQALQSKKANTNTQFLRLYRRFLRLSPFIEGSRNITAYKSLLRLRFKEDYNDKRAIVLDGKIIKYTQTELILKSLKTLEYLNYILTYTSPDPVHLKFFANYLHVHQSKQKLFQSKAKKEPMIRNDFENLKGGVLNGTHPIYGGIEYESYRDFERVLLMFNESEGLCL